VHLAYVASRRCEAPAASVASFTAWRRRDLASRSRTPRRHGPASTALFRGRAV